MTDGNPTPTKRPHIWISRSHLYAAGAGVLLLVGTSFGLGAIAGRSEMQVPTPQTKSYVNVEDGELVALLGRVEANAARGGGVQALTFPAALKGGEPIDVPVALDVSQEAIVIQAPQPAVGHSAVDLCTLRVDEVSTPEEARDIQKGLETLPYPVWISISRYDDGIRYAIHVGSFHNTESAKAALHQIEVLDLGDFSAAEVLFL